MFKRQNAEEGIKKALLDIIKQAGHAIKRFRNLGLTYATVNRAEYEYQQRNFTGLMRHRVFPMPQIRHITGGPHFDGHDIGYFTCLKMNALVPFVPECAVLKCEPLDSEILLGSQQWMGRVLEPMDETRQPFVLGKLHSNPRQWFLPRIFSAIK
jgi:hypothetical protein